MAIPSRLTDRIREKLDPAWLEVTFSDLWERNAQSIGDKEALVDSRTRLTWFQANQRINQIGYGFVQLGYNKDDCVVVQLPNVVELALIRVACERAGLLFLPIVRTLRGKEVEYILNKVNGKMFVTLWRYKDFDHFQMIQEMRDRVPVKDVVVVGEETPAGAITFDSMLKELKDEEVYRKAFENRKCSAIEFSCIASTTGSTGFPKFVQKPIFSMMEHSKAQVERVGMTADDVVSIIAPTSGGPNTFGYLDAPLVGAKTVMIEQFEAEETLRRVEREKITLLSVVPTMALKMTDHDKFKDYDLSSLRVVIMGGAACPPDVMKKLEETLERPVTLWYGGVDVGIGTLCSPNDSTEVRWKSVGRMFGDFEAKIVKEDGSTAATGEAGEVYLRGPHNYTGYHKDPEANQQVWTEDNWYKSGDLGKVDGQGNLYLVGRIKDIIIRGGQNISPSEVEASIEKHEKVAAVAIVGMPDNLMGEKVVAYVVPRTPTLDEINAFLRANKIAAYKLPERLEIVAELPMVGDSGKVDKKVLRQDIAQKLERKPG